MTAPSLNILHATSWLTRNGGGIPPVVWALAREQTRAKAHCHVVGLNDPYVTEDCASQPVAFTAGAIRGPIALGFSPQLNHFAQTNPAQWQIVHTHGLWMYPGVTARSIANAAHCPLVISPHGMLEPWALNNSRWKKRIAGWLFENQNLKTASCLHALCTPEAENIRRFGSRKPIAIIPNGVAFDELHPLPDHDAITAWAPDAAGKCRILFLSRLHPKKGLTNLLKAWAQIQAKASNWVLLIAGSGAPEYEQELKNLSAILKIEKTSFFLGSLHGQRKREALAGADAFVLPSFSEGLSMATLEAAAAGLPVLHTSECNFSELTTAHAAIEVPATSEGVETGLRQLLGMSPEQRLQMGQYGLEMVKHAYCWPRIAAKMIELYQWLRKERAMPDFVQLPG